MTAVAAHYDELLAYQPLTEATGLIRPRWMSALTLPR